jgi:solute:Na+ symporter, SSS family
MAQPPTATMVLIAGLIILSGGAAAHGAEETVQAVSGSAGGLVAIDWVLIGLYGVATLALGWYYSRRQETTSEYFVGSGKMNPLLIGISLFATLLSTISYLAMPGETLGKGPVFLATLAAYPFVYLLVGHWLLPVYMRHRVTSAYELLERRLGLSLRLLGAIMFIALRLVWMSLLMYLTAKAIVVMIDNNAVIEERDQHLIPIVAAVTGLVAVIYTSMGGLRAVVVTDFMQTLLLYGGALVVLGLISWDFGGFGWFPLAWQPHWDQQPIMSFDPKVRVSLLGSALSLLIWHVCTAGGDQTSVQRFMATTDVRTARRALAVQLSCSVVVGLTLGLVGFALLGYFQAHPERLPVGMHLSGNADDIFPMFIAYHLPPGISGLVVAGMFAAAMSSLDSGVNSITAVVMTDFFDRFGFTPKSETGHVRASQILAFSIGLFVVVGSSFMGAIPGNITAMTQKTSNLLTTPIFCLFVFALFIPFARPLGVWLGAITGTLTAAAIAFSGPLVVWLSHHGFDPALVGTEVVRTVHETTGVVTETAQDPISFQWIALAAIIVNLGVGTAVSLLLPRRTPASGTTPT